MPRYYLIYDDSCPICLASIDRLRKIDTLGIVELVPLSDPRLPHGQSLPPQHELKNAVHLFDDSGQMYRGAEAVAQVMSIFPTTAWISRIMGWPGIRQLARVIYGVVARNRVKLSKAVAR
ncbi:MAG: DUF393 domain-containing protein [bacterium]|nr:DUF393 domain-containing protein [bacterium]